MPHTVPKRPTKGAVEPTDASTVRPASRREVDRAMDFLRARVRNSPLSRPPPRVWLWAWWRQCSAAAAAWLASSAHGEPGAVFRRVLRPLAREGALQKASTASPRRPTRARRSNFRAMRYQLATDMATSSRPTAWAVRRAGAGLSGRVVGPSGNGRRPRPGPATEPRGTRAVAAGLPAEFAATG